MSESERDESETESPSISRRAPVDVVERLRESYYVYGHARCAACQNKRIDLTAARDIGEAAEIWNAHVENEHDGGYDSPESRR